MIAANKITENRLRWRAWMWLCPWAMVGLAVAILFFAGLSIWTALLAAMLLVCPAIMIWGAIKIRQQNRKQAK